MWRLWRPFLVLIVIGLGSGAPSTTEIPVVAQEPLSATESTSSLEAQLLSGLETNPGNIEASASILKTSTSTSDNIEHIRADATSPGSNANKGDQSDLSLFMENLGKNLQSWAIRLVGSMNPQKTASSGYARPKRETESISLWSQAMNSGNTYLIIDQVLGGVHISNLGNINEGFQKLARLLNPPKTSTSTSDDTADNRPEDITDKPMKCRFKTTKTDEYDLGVCPSGCYSWPMKGQCWCPRTSKADCETVKHCHWSVITQVEGKCRHNSELLGSLLNKPSASDFIGQDSNIEFNPGSNALSDEQSDLLAELLRSTGEPPLDVSEFFEIAAAVAVSESATGSNSGSKTEGIEALASLLTRANWTKSTNNRIGQAFDGGAVVEEEAVVSCRFSRTNALGGSGLGGCAKHCATLFPALSGQCICPRNTKDDCEAQFGCTWSATDQACIHHYEGLYSALLKNVDNRDDKKDRTEEPYQFAYSLAISPVAAAGISTTGEIGVAFGSTGEILGFAGRCLGIKADVSVELDIALGFWNSVDDILGPIYQVGVGADTSELKNENGTDETGAHVEQIYNPDGGDIGFAISLGYGYGVDLPIDWEVNFDKCHNYELFRLHWKDLYKMIWESEPRPLEPVPSEPRPPEPRPSRIRPPRTRS